MKSSALDSSLLDACLLGHESEALVLIGLGRGLRHHCSRRDIEPLGACARLGLGMAFDALLAAAHFGPYESALDQALGEASIHGHADIALRAWKAGSALDIEATVRAVEAGSWDALGGLLEAGAFDQRLVDGSSLRDLLMHACCERGADALAARCIRLGSCLAGEEGEAAAMDIARHRLVQAASAFLDKEDAAPPCAKAAWEESFPALMQSRRDQRALRSAVRARASAAPKRRL